MPRGPGSQTPLEAILGIGDDDTPAPKRGHRVIRQDKTTRPTLLRPEVPGAGTGTILDPETQREIERIQMEGELALAEHAQRVAAANAEAAQQRRAVDRDIGIQNAYRPLAVGSTQQGYDELMSTLEGIIPLTQQAYDTGVQEIDTAYDQSVQNLAQPAPVGMDLAAQLEQISGGPVGEFAADVNDPLTYMSGLLEGSGNAAEWGLATLGAGDVGAAQTALPGYGLERDQEISDINLDVDAQLNALRNERSMITSDFIPFNAAALQMDQEEAIRRAIEEGMARQEQEAEMDFQGYRGVQDLATQYNRPDLAEDFWTMYTTAGEGLADPTTNESVPMDVLIQRAINEYVGGNGKGTRQSQMNDRQILQQLYEVMRGNY